MRVNHDRWGRPSSYRREARTLVRRTDFRCADDFYTSLLLLLTTPTRPRGLPRV